MHHQYHKFWFHLLQVLLLALLKLYCDILLHIIYAHNKQFSTNLLAI